MAAAVAAASQWLALPQPAAARSASSQKVDPQLLAAFQEALSAKSYEDMEAAWSKAISLAPDNAAAWSNRGTARLQNGQWQAAYEDLLAAVRLEEQQLGAPNGLTLNNLGNAEGALGRWQDAMRHYEAAADDADVGSIALANYALAAFETGDNELAMKSARSLLRRDAQFMDMRCALAAFLWGSGQRSAAEGQWEQLQQEGDGLGAAMYSRSTAVERVRHRWPPRATAALVAFLSLSDVGQAEGDDLQMHEYNFAVL